MANFSQGEWLINSHLDITCNGRYVAFVCYSNPITPLNNQSTVHANARLIAAAPKMYELLKLCLTYSPRLKAGDSSIFNTACRNRSYYVYATS